MKPLYILVKYKKDFDDIDMIQEILYLTDKKEKLFSFMKRNRLYAYEFSQIDYDPELKKDYIYRRKNIFLYKKIDFCSINVYSPDAQSIFFYTKSLGSDSEILSERKMIFEPLFSVSLEDKISSQIAYYDLTNLASNKVNLRCFLKLKNMINNELNKNILKPIYDVRVFGTRNIFNLERLFKLSAENSGSYSLALDINDPNKIDLSSFFFLEKQSFLKKTFDENIYYVIETRGTINFYFLFNGREYFRSKDFISSIKKISPDLYEYLAFNREEKKFLAYQSLYNQILSKYLLQLKPKNYKRKLL